MGWNSSSDVERKYFVTESCLLVYCFQLFIGVGFPYEGPGPMEAMAAGTVYIQPKVKWYCISRFTEEVLKLIGKGIHN